MSMKPKILLAIYVCVALLPSIVYCKTLMEYADDVGKLAEENVLINDVFKPYPGLKGKGSFAFIYFGHMYPNDKKIAMKFTVPWEDQTAFEEYAMYNYLNAINNTVSEKHGIPSVCNTVAVGHCLHDDIHLENLMVHKFRTFIIDLNVAAHMEEQSGAGTPEYASRRFHWGGERGPVDDWESFLYSMCAAIPGVKFDWLGLEKHKMLKYKEDTNKTINRIKKIKSKKLKEIFVRFAKHIFYDCIDRNPDYDTFYNLIDAEIHSFAKPNGLTEPVMFTWLKGEARADAIAELNRYPTPNISKLIVPSNYHEFSYVEPDPEFFTRKYADWKN